MSKDQEWHLQTSLPVSFYIKNSTNIFNIDNGDILKDGTQGPGSRRIVVIDQKVRDLYINNIVQYLEHYEIDYHIITMDATESNKNIDSLMYLLEEIESFGLTRKSEPIIAVGGGVLLDIVGLAASLYRRGVPYIKVPTTLLGVVDVGVGVKTSINFLDRRNRLGTYYPPIAAFIDISFFSTLETVEISSGLGEILKMAVVKDKRLFTILKKHGEELYVSKFLESNYAEEVINRAVKGMKNELEDNLWEKNLQRYVDFGHSFSPIPEMRSLIDDNVKTLTHGEAVTLDVILSSVISHLRGMLSKEDVIDIYTTTRSLGLPTYHPYFEKPDILLEALNDTVKHRNGDQNLPIPKNIGDSVFINDLSYDEIKKSSQLMVQFHNNLG